ncbi:MAG: hypothetical protein Q9185_000492 [Variospora sp. 1 TL-2023]
MVSYKEIIDNQLWCDFRDEDGEKAAPDLVEEAVDEAVEIAAELRSRGDIVTRGEIEKHLDALLCGLDKAMTHLAKTWSDFEKAAQTYTKWTQRGEQALAKLEEFMKTKYRHDRAIGEQKQLIQELATKLKPLQDQHTTAYPNKPLEKAGAVAKASAHADGQEILRETTVCSAMKQGHERQWSLLLAQTEHDLLTAGKELTDMLCVERGLRRKANRAVRRSDVAAWQLHASGQKHDRARLRGACRMEAIAVFAKVLRLANPVRLAKMSVRLSVQLHHTRPEKGYAWACRFVRMVVARAETAAAVDDDVEGKVGEAMEAVLRVERGEGGAVEEEGKSERGVGGGGRKKKGKGQGRGKK